MSMLRSIVRCIQFELHRALYSPLFYVMQFLVITLFCISLFMNQGRIQASSVDWTIWFIEGITGSSTLLPLVVSLLCVIPHSLWHRVDISTNYLPYYVFRIHKFTYIVAKCISEFILGALSIFCSLLFCFILCAALFPSQVTTEGWLPVFLFSDLYMQAPFLYCLLLICNTSLYAGVYCLVGLAISAMSEKPYSAIIGPFVTSMFLHVVFSFAGLPGLSPLSLIMLEYNSNTTALQVYGEVLILAQISILLFSFFGRKNLIK